MGRHQSAPAAAPLPDEPNVVSSANTFNLQYVAWSFTHAPTLGAVSKLTTLGQIGFSAASA